MIAYFLILLFENSNSLRNAHTLTLTPTMV